MKPTVQDGLTENQRDQSTMSDELPRSERTCSRCDHSRTVQLVTGPELRCWVDPPIEYIVAMEAPQVVGGLPKARTWTIQRRTWPEYNCSKWCPMQPDHPDLQPVEQMPVPNHEGSEKTQ